MGRVTYQEMSSYWPQSDDPYAAPMNHIPKVVFSKTLSDVEATWPETRVARVDLTTEIWRRPRSPDKISAARAGVYRTTT